jgi:hypothetical protein
MPHATMHMHVAEPDVAVVNVSTHREQFLSSPHDASRGR